MDIEMEEEDYADSGGNYYTDDGLAEVARQAMDEYDQKHNLAVRLTSRFLKRPR